ncbi:thioredoxin reductase-like selenoprotein T1b, partial [Actinia tenebrosa]|uniref:Thioredoxin reductase-like selenoprotein T1b n=1 Tax=Actinia tenebrosa TaxID=6105 RepID=A0A6P8I295_ACTTE
GYKRVFEEYAQFLGQNFPNLNIVGDNYPPPRPRQMLASFLSIAKMVVIGLIIFGERMQIFESLNVNPPSIYQWAIQNKMYSCILLFFICNTIEGQLISTGAFEVTFNDIPVWSKLQAGRLPSPSELHQIVENQLKFAPSQ